MSEYSTLLAESVLRQRARLAEHSARVETQQAGRVKSEFIANMSHELRTPLNAVIGFARLLGEHERRQLRDAEIVEYADLIREAADHLLVVINGILDISKMQSGKCTLDAAEVDIGELLQIAVAAHQPAAFEADIVLNGRFGPDLPAVRGDPVKLRQVFGNLLGNALRFTPRKGSVTVEAHALQGGGTLVQVRDTGLGMSTEEISIALTPFAQVDGGRSRRREGSGLGLPIAKALVQLHGGRLDIESSKGQGTVVSVRLPCPSDVSHVHGRDCDRVAP